MDWVPFHSTEETHVTVCSRAYWDISGKRPHLECGNEAAHPSGKKSAGCSVSTSSVEIRKKGRGCDGWHS